MLLAKDSEETAYQVYKGLWNDFYDWERDYCRLTLQGLEKPAVCSEDFPLAETSGDEVGLFDSLNEFTEWFTVDESGYEDALPLQLLLQEEGVAPHSSYSSCTPSSANAHLPKNFMDKASFTPFSDEPRFKTDKYLSLFNTFGWQTDFWDPDREIIFLETARRLHYGHGFTYVEIDDLRFHYVPLRVHGSAGMIWEVSQRDRLLWPGSEMSLLPDLVTQAANFLNSDVHESVTKGIISFCDNLNCLRSACLAHDESHPIIDVKPTMTSKDFGSIDGIPCNRDCFKCSLRTDAGSELSNVRGSWNEEDVSLFSNIMKFAPDSSPCDIAVICRKPCVDIYIQRCRHIADDRIEAEKEEPLITELPILTFEEDDLGVKSGMTIEDRVKQCYHPGACNQYSNCSCYNNSQRCQRTCRCLKTCILRFKGCKCNGHRPCAEAEDCPCQRAGRECDPEVCIACDARNSKGGRALSCRNTILQRGRFPIWIHSSKYGLGAFALNKIDKGSCVGDYVGEFVGEEGVAFDRIRKFLHRNYAFGLTQTFSLDSYLLGNETRYLNHSKSANCSAKVMVVNGDLRIGIFADEGIKKNGELFLDYGENYWNEDGSGSEDVD